MKIDAIYTPEAIRAYQSAVIMQQEVTRGVNQILSTNDGDVDMGTSSELCPIHIEDSLTNSDKASETYWIYENRSRLSAIISDKNTR